MDTINHAVQGVIIHSAIGGFINCLTPIGIGWEVAIGLTGLVAIIPDLDTRYGKWYVSMHRGKINKWMRWVPAWGAHTRQDLYCHNDESKGLLNNRWYASKTFDTTGDAKFWEYFVPSKYAEKMWYQSLTWSINILITTITLVNYVH